MRKDNFPKLLKNKLIPHYGGSYRVLERVDDSAYKFELPDELIGVSATFNVADL